MPLPKRLPKRGPCKCCRKPESPLRPSNTPTKETPYFCDGCWWSPTNSLRDCQHNAGPCPMCGSGPYDARSIGAHMARAHGLDEHGVRA